MPIWKYKSDELDKAERDLWYPPGDPRVAKAWRAIVSLSAALPEAPPIRGVRAFRTVEEMNADDEAWIQRRVEAGKKRKRIQND